MNATETRLMSTSVVYDRNSASETAFALRVARTLQKAGGSVFVEDDHMGDKLHRIARQAASQDRMIVVASPSSLEEGHVSFQLQLMLDREARDGGEAYILPIAYGRGGEAFDLKRWVPRVKHARSSDIAFALSTRVALDAPPPTDTAGFEKMMLRLLAALART